MALQPLDRDAAEAAKFVAEAEQLRASTRKLRVEAALYPVAIATGALIALLGVLRLFY